MDGWRRNFIPDFVILVKWGRVVVVEKLRDVRSKPFRFAAIVFD